MTDHFSLLVNPEELRFVAKRFDEMQDHLGTKGKKASACPADIGDEWQGTAATAIKAEMTGLGGQMSGFSTQFAASSAAITSLAKDYDQALTQVETLNKKWAAADQTYHDAITTAGTKYDDATKEARKLKGPVIKVAQQDASDSRGYAETAADGVRGKARQELESEYALMKTWLAGRTSAAGTKLSQAAPSKVTAQQIDDWKNGRYPTRLDHPGLLASMAEAAAREDREVQAELKSKGEADAKTDVAKLKDMERLSEPDSIKDPQAFQALLSQIGARAKDPYYAKALVDDLGPGGIKDVYDNIDYTVAVNLSGDHNTQLDYVGPLKAFNDTLASGLAQYDDGSFTTFVDDFSGSVGSPSRLAWMAASTYADSRLTGTTVSLLDRMGEVNSHAGGLRRDIATDQLGQLYGDLDKMAGSLADRTDTTTFAHYYHSLDSDHQAAMRVALLNDGMSGDQYTLRSSGMKAKGTIFAGLVDDAADRGDEAEVNQLLSQLMDAPDRQHMSIGSQELVGEQLKSVFEDPAHIRFFAENVGKESYQIDPEMLGRVATMALKDVDIPALAAQVASLPGGPERAAGDIGFLLGLSDVAGTKVDYSGVIESLISLGLEKSGSPLSAAFDPLSELYDAMKEADETYGKYGDGLDQANQEKLLSFAIYSARNGAPPGFDAYVKAHKAEFSSDQKSAGENQTDRYIQGYLADASNSTDPTSPQYLAWKAMNDYMLQINQTRDFGK